MNEELYIIRPKQVTDLMMQMINAACGKIPNAVITEADDLPDLRNKQLIWAIDLDLAGYCLPLMQIISKLYQIGNDSLKGSIGVLLICSPNEYNTKSTAADIVFQLNLLGCKFPGHPVVEAVQGLVNFKTWQKTIPMTLEEICLEQASRLGARLMESTSLKRDTPHILALHSSSSITSNTLALWNMIKGQLSKCIVEELHVENGTIKDCKGCSFTTCSYYSKQSSCFYGGVLVEEIYPAVEKADAVVWICPNYNDSISANISAVINRLTALYRKTGFYDKALFSVIVSGNSGSDSVAMQLLDALCINKGFYLPPSFCITATAYDPGSILAINGIQKQAKSFAENILKTFE